MSSIPLQKTDGAGFCIIRPDAHDIQTHLLSDTYKTEIVKIAGADVLQGRRHPQTPIIIFPVRQFIQVFWRNLHDTDVSRTILGGTPQASCFQAVAIEPNTVYTIRNMMANPVLINRYHPPLNNRQTIQTIHTSI